MTNCSKTLVALVLVSSTLALSPVEAAPRRRAVAKPLPAPVEAAVSTPPSEAAVRLILDGYEPLDLEAQIRKLGTPAAETLLRILQTPNLPALVQLRATGALGYAPTAAGEAYLLGVVSQIGMADDHRALHLSAALSALGAFGPRHAPRLAELLAHTSADVREGAIRGLLASGAPQAASALQERLRVERDSGVKRTLDVALLRLRKQ